MKGKKKKSKVEKHEQDMLLRQQFASLSVQKVPERFVATGSFTSISARQVQPELSLEP